MKHQYRGEAMQVAAPEAAPRLADANINPVTGFATDYLNHFNEAVMLLEMLPDCPDCIDDFLAWRPMTYREHFMASNFKGRDLAVAAYNAANPALRDCLDTMATTMIDVLEATRESMWPQHAAGNGRRARRSSRSLGQAAVGPCRRLDQRRRRLGNDRRAGNGGPADEDKTLNDVRTYPTRPFLAVSAAIFRDGKVLVVRRARKPALNLYTMPGGVVEAGETLTEAVAREVREETSLQIEVLRLAGHREAMVRDAQGRVERHFVIMCFAARWISGEAVLNEELDDARWLDPSEIANLRTTDGLAEIVADAAIIVNGKG
jgi:ADP-ribose pyrophosphatase YjhB (NUDIX family)